MMRIFVIGSGAREHALAWKIAQSPRVTQIFINACNGSITSLKARFPHKSFSHVDILDNNFPALARFASDKMMDLVVIGSEAPLAAGLSDDCKKLGIATFGCSKRAAEIEVSKAFAKDFMQR